jgi:uncharacterized protein DUF3551
VGSSPTARTNKIRRLDSRFDYRDDTIIVGKSASTTRSGPRPQPIRNEDMMMRILALIILAVVTVGKTAPAQAQTYDPAYPVCLQIYQGMVDYYFECRYTSIPQCQASASGRAAQCVVNPYYAKPVPRKKRRTSKPHA